MWIGRKRCRRLVVRYINVEINGITLTLKKKDDDTFELI